MIQHFQRKRSILFVALVLCLLLIILLLANVRQVTLPLTGIQTNRQAMPPDPDDWCRKVDLIKLSAEIARAETYFNEGVGENLVDWTYLRLSLRYTGVQVNGPEDLYWLETIRGLYTGCNR